MSLRRAIEGQSRARAVMQEFLPEDEWVLTEKKLE